MAIFGSDKLKIVSFGLALGVTFAICMFLTAIAAWLWGFGQAWVDLTATVYIGYEASFVGAVIGAIWAFVDGFVGGVVFSWLYNKFTKTVKE